MDTRVSGPEKPPKCPTIITDIKPGKPYVLPNKGSKSRDKAMAQTAEELAKRKRSSVMDDIEVQTLPQCESMQTCHRSRKQKKVFDYECE